MTPIERAIAETKAKFTGEFGFPPERIHMSMSVEKAIRRMFKQRLKNEKYAVESVLGLEMFRMTRPTTHVQFYVSAIRDGLVYSLEAKLEPEDIGAKRIEIPGETILQ